MATVKSKQLQMITTRTAGRATGNGKIKGAANHEYPSGYTQERGKSHPRTPPTDLQGPPKTEVSVTDLRRRWNLDPYETCTGMAQTDISPNLKETGFFQILFLSSWRESAFRPRLCSV